MACDVQRGTVMVLAGRTLGEFVVADKLGEGGFGEVYRALQPSLGRDAVVKVMRADGGATPQRFLREAQLAAQLDHPYAAHVYAFGAEDDGVLWIAMEHIRGTPLSSMLLLHGPLPLDRFVPLFERLCEVVHAAHARGIIHRDLKPSNVVVVAHAGRLVPKLIDLGIAGYARQADPGPARRQPVTGPLDATAETVDAPTGSSPVIGTLTQTGQLLGSPLYMAPEQWSDPTRLDARSDIYALGVVAFECLTGHPPFVASDRDELQRLHFDEPPPELPRDLPRALSREIARALAKDPADRQLTAIDLGAALRAASGLGIARIELPKLPRALLDRVLAAAPRPIADAVAGVDAAVSVRELSVALDLTTRAVVRFAGVVALAARAALPAARAGLDRAQPLLDQLPRRTLTEDEWLRLAIALCVPLLDVRDAFPVPELLDVLAGIGPGRSALAMLADERDDARDDEAEHRRLAQGLRDLGTALDALAFLDGYALSDGTRTWRGASRCEPASGGGIRLLGPDGDAAVDFGPLVRIASPLPGAPAEPFVFDGRGPRGALLKSARGNELAADDVWGWLARLCSTEERTRPDPEARSPYPGLAPFGIDDAAHFFGRDAELATFRNRLRVAPLIAIVGASGAGKSSFVLAGVAPDLAATWQPLVLRPGVDPVSELAAAFARLAGVAAATTELEADLVADPAGFARRLREAGGWRGSASSRDDRGLLIIVDQLEELFTLCADGTRRDAFCRVLDLAARSASDPIRVVATLRADFLARTEEIPALSDRIAAGLFLLATPSAEGLTRALVEPCRRAGYDFDTPELPDRIVADVAGRPAALPLLAFAASRLWELRDASFHVLRTGAYEAIGGVTGALIQHVEATYAGMPSDHQRRARRLLCALVTSDGTRATLSRGEAIRIAGGNAAAERVVEVLLADRLLTVRDTLDGERIELAHEALIEAWPRLATWREDDRVDAKMRDQVRTAARSWIDRGRADGALWSGEALRDLEHWCAAHPDALTDADAEFAARSRAVGSRTRRRRRLAAIAAFVVLAVALAIITWLNARTSRERDRAEQSAERERLEKGETLVESGRRASLAGSHRAAIRDVTDALELGHDSVTARVVLGRAVATLRHRKAVLRGHQGQLSALAVDASTRRIATGGADRTVRLWSAEGTSLATFAAPSYVFHAAFSPDGRHLTACGYDGFAAVWTLATGVARRLDPGDGFVMRCDFLRAGTRVATRTAAGVVRLWDVETGALAFELPRHDQPWNELFLGELADGRLVTISDGEKRIRLWDAGGRSLGAIDTDDLPGAAAIGVGDAIVTAGRTRHAVQFWSVAEKRKLAEVAAHTARIVALRVSPDGSRVVTASSDGDARVWAVETRAPISRLAGAASAYDARFDEAGHRVVLASSDGARIFDARTGLLHARVDGHDHVVWSAAFVRDRVATLGWDGTAQLWSVGGDLVAEHGPVEALDFVQEIAVDRARGRFAVGQRGRIVILDAKTGAPVRTAKVSDGTPISLEFTAEGGLVAITDTGRVTVFRPDGSPAAERVLAGRDSVPRRIALSPDGRHAAVATELAATEVFELPGLAPVVRLAERTAAFSSRRSMLAWHESGTLAVIREDGQVDLWGPSLQRRATLVTRATVVAFHDRIVATAGQDGTVSSWNVASGSLASVHAGHGAEVFGLTWLPGGLASASADGSLRRWPASVLDPPRVFRGHDAQVVAVDGSFDGRFVASGALDATLRLWDASTGRELQRIGAHAGAVYDVRWVAEDRIATTGNDGVIRLWAVEVGATAPQHELVAEARCLLEGNVDCTSPQQNASR